MLACDNKLLSPEKGWSALSSPDLETGSLQEYSHVPTYIYVSFTLCYAYYIFYTEWLWLTDSTLTQLCWAIVRYLSNLIVFIFRQCDNDNDNFSFFTSF